MEKESGEGRDCGIYTKRWLSGSECNCTDIISRRERHRLSPHSLIPVEESKIAKYSIRIEELMLKLLCILLLY